MRKIMRVILPLTLSVSLMGCATGMFGGKSGTRFNASVQDVYDASLAVFEDENMPVVRKSISTDYAQVDSEYPNGTKVHVIARATSPQYAETNVRVGTIGEDYRAYDLMKQIESKLKR